MPDRFSVMECLAAGWLTALTVVSIASPALPLPSPVAVDLTEVLSRPSKEHWLGTDELGRDMAARLVDASRSTLIVSAGATVLALSLGVLIGSAAGLMGGAPDRFVRFMIDLLWSIPFVILVVLVVTVVGVNRLSLIVAIGGITWVSSARVVRAAVTKVRDSRYLLAAKAFGFPSSKLARDQILPSIGPVVMTLAAYGAVEIVTLETGLAFLGLSLPAPRPTWGGILAQGLAYFAAGPWIMSGAAVLITATLASLQIIARRLERSRILA